MAAFENMAVDKLIIWENLEHIRIESVNKVTKEKKIVYLLEENIVFDNDVDIISNELLIDWLLDLNDINKENYKQYCKSVHIVSENTRLGTQFTKGFGGLGAFLRFPFEYDMEDGLDGLNNNDDFNDDDFI